MHTNPSGCKGKELFTKRDPRFTVSMHSESRLSYKRKNFKEWDEEEKIE